jgi:hypothetical protein
VNEAGIFLAILEAHLADGFEKGQRFDIAHGAADFHQRHVGILRTLANGTLDLVGDVRDDLHRAAEVIAAALLADHRLVDLAGREVVALAHLHVGEALVVAEVEVGLRPVVGDEHLPVLEGAHGARIDVE